VLEAHGTTPTSTRRDPWPDVAAKEDFMKSIPGTLLICAAITLPLLDAVDAVAGPPVAVAKAITNTRGGRNEQAVVDKRGKAVLFVSNVDHASGVLEPGVGAFDFDGSGNGFSSSEGPQCTNCTTNDDSVGNLYLWRMRGRKGVASNSIVQLTFSDGGGFDANENPDMDQGARWVVWNSDQDHVGTNADGNGEIFFMEISSGAISQVTLTTGGSRGAQRLPTIDDEGQRIAFLSTRDFSDAEYCRRPDRTSPCDNGDQNAEVMVYDRSSGRLTQVTDTTGDGADANGDARVSADGSVLVFRSSRDFSGVLTGGLSCTAMGSGGLCSNDGNGEIMLYEIDEGRLTQITQTINQTGCNDKTSSEAPEVSGAGAVVVFQSECEAQLNPVGCGACNGNDEAFLVEVARGRISQITISDAGWNRSPRISDAGNYLAFESNRDLLGTNPNHSETVFVLKRSSAKVKAGHLSRMQLAEDSVLEAAGVERHPRVRATGVSVAGGFSLHGRIGLSSNGRVLAFESSQDVGNQEVWFVDRSRTR
jgi:Tol biopolymer transport system component